MSKTTFIGDKEVISEEKLAELRDAFQVFDQDNDGIITIIELGNILRKFVTITQQNLKDMISDIDLDGSESINFKEFLDLMCTITKEDKEEEMLDLFRIYDRNSKGYITREDLKIIMGHLEEKIMDEELDELMKDYDLEGNGQLNFEEFKDLMRLS